MKFSSAVISATLIVCAAAATQSSTASQSVESQSPVDACYQKCRDNSSAKDLTTCMANCSGNPAPSEQQVKDNTACVQKCPQSDGSSDGNKKYGLCVESCRNTHFLPSSQSSGVTPTETPSSTGTQGSGDSSSGSGTPAGPASSGSGTPAGSASSGSGTPAVSGKPKPSGSSTSNNTNNTSPTQGSGKGGASGLVVSISFAGIAAAFAAVLAL